MTTVFAVCSLMMGLMGLSCQNPPEPEHHETPVPKFTLALVEAGAGYAAMQIHVADTAGVRSFLLRRDSSDVLSVLFPSSGVADTTVTDSALQRAHQYRYRLYRYVTDSAGHRVMLDSSAVITAATLNQSSISLQPVDIGVSDCYLKVTLADRNPIRSITITRRNIDSVAGVRVFSGRLEGLDTIIYDRGLRAARQYRYSAMRTNSAGMVVDTLDQPLVLTSMDTTSHNMTWMAETLGVETSSLADVAIINDQDIWVVGELWRWDSMGNNASISPAAHWTAAGWEYKTLRFYDPVLQGRVQISNLDGVWAFSRNDIWFAGGYVFHWDGDSLKPIIIADSANPQGKYMRKVWGTSSNDIWAVGRTGAILHFNGIRWEKIPTQEQVDLNDVWGSPDGSVVWISGLSDYDSTIIYRYSNHQLKKVYLGLSGDAFRYYPDKVSGTIFGVWTQGPYRLYANGSVSLYQSDVQRIGSRSAVALTGPNIDNEWPGWAVRGTASNDIFCAGWQFIWHYNGSTWQKGPDVGRSVDGIKRLAVAGRMVIGVGDRWYDGVRRYGVVYWGRR